MSALTQPRDDLLGVHSELAHAHAYLQEAFFPSPVTPALRLPNALYNPGIYGERVDTEVYMLLSTQSNSSTKV